MELELYKMEAKDGMQEAISSYQVNLNKISAGRANPQLLNSVKVDYYETLTPLNELASISVPEPRQLLVKPFDMNINKDIVSAINSASLGVQAVNEGHQARITIPALTQERRRELVKSLTQYTEQARVKVRQARQDANKMIKADEELTEDDERIYLDAIQKLTDEHINIINEMTKEKEKDLMTI